MGQHKARAIPASNIQPVRERAPPFPRLTPTGLKRWRLRQQDPATGKSATHAQAAAWYGCSKRAWQYWEAVPPRPHRAIPAPLIRRIVVLHETIFPTP